ncbi:MAG: hypothetical protein LBJ47_12135 [Tannerella sp.]|jgi:YesN/AraC family two-component response regulator|nr:hypothetical protein [Tannerella sp.]
MRVIIIEDEYAPRRMLREKLEQLFSDMEIVAECENAEDALIDYLVKPVSPEIPVNNRYLCDYFKL